MTNDSRRTQNFPGIRCKIHEFLFSIYSGRGKG